MKAGKMARVQEWFRGYEEGEGRRRKLNSSVNMKLTGWEERNWAGTAASQLLPRILSEVGKKISKKDSPTKNDGSRASTHA